MARQLALYRQLDGEGRLNEPLSVEDVENLVHQRHVVQEQTPEGAVSSIFRENAAAAAQTVVNIALFGKNERTRLAAAQYVVERVVGRVQDNPPVRVDDPFSEFLEKITSDAE